MRREDITEGTETQQFWRYVPFFSVVACSGSFYRGKRQVYPLPPVPPALQVDRPSVAPHVEALLHALMVCFKDMGWPVRDAACIAFGRWGRRTRTGMRLALLYA